VINWLYDFDTFNTLHDHGKAFIRAFRGACQYGRLQVAQWLYSLGNVWIQANDSEAFRKACEFGQLHVVQWIF
jgi:hypothetical protein